MSEEIQDLEFIPESLTPDALKGELLIEYKDALEALGVGNPNEMLTPEPGKTLDEKLDDVDLYISRYEFEARDARLFEILLYDGVPEQDMAIDPMDLSIEGRITRARSFSGEYGKYAAKCYGDTVTELNTLLSNSRITYASGKVELLSNVLPSFGPKGEKSNTLVFVLEDGTTANQEFRSLISSAKETYPFTIEKDGVDVTSAFFDKINKFEKRNQIAELLERSYMDLSPFFEAKNALPPQEKRAFYEDWAQTMDVYRDKVLKYDSTMSIVEKFDQLQLLLSEHPSIDGMLKTWLLRMGMSDIVTSYIRQQYKKDFSACPEKLVQLLVGGPVLDFDLGTADDFGSNKNVLAIGEDGEVSIYYGTQASYDRTSKRKDGKLSGAVFIPNSPIAAFNGSILAYGPGFSHTNGFKEHEEKHRENHLISADIRLTNNFSYVAPLKDPSRFSILTQEGTTAYLGASLAMFDARVKDEILAYGTMPGKGETPKQISATLGKDDGLYFNLKKLYQDVTPVESFQTAFIAAPHISFEQVWKDIWTKKQKDIARWCVLASKVSNKTLLAVTPVSSWENLVE